MDLEANETNSTPEAPSDNSELDSGLVDSMLAEDTSYESGESSPSAAPAEPAAPSAAAPAVDPASPQPSAPAVPTAPPPAAAPQAAAQPEAQPPQAAAVPPQSSQEEPPAQIVDFAKHREEYLPKLAELYKLNDQEVELLRTSPETALPQLAARLHYEVQVASTQALLRVLPQFIENTMAETAARKSSEEKFFNDWPGLKEKVTADPKAKETIVSSIKAIRAQNPNADLASVIKQAGILASMTLGVPLPGTAPAAVPAAPANVPSGVPRPIGRPAGAGASGAGHAPPASAGENSDVDELFSNWQSGAI